MTNEANAILTKLVEVNDQFAGLPAGLLVFFLSMALAYALTWWRLFDNQYVAPVVTFVGTVLFFFLSPERGPVPMRIWIGKNIVIGCVSSIVASVLILRFGAKIPIIGKYLQVSSNTDFLNNPNK